MKKISLILCSLFLFYSCLNNDNAPDFTYEYLPIDEAIIPASFTFGETENITIKYSFPNGCYSFDELYYEFQDPVRIIAVTATVSLDTPCTQAIIEKEHTFPVRVTQRENYIFKFWKGNDSQGNNMYEEIVIPVN